MLAFIISTKLIHKSKFKHISFFNEFNNIMPKHCFRTLMRTKFSKKSKFTALYVLLRQSSYRLTLYSIDTVHVFTSAAADDI